MYEEQFAKQQAAMSQGMIGAGTATAPRPQPVIDGQVQQIDQQLHGIFELVGRICTAVDRLVSPEPQPVDGSGKNAERAMHSIDQRLNAIIQGNEMLATYLSRIASRLDSAV